MPPISDRFNNYDSHVSRHAEQKGGLQEWLLQNAEDNSEQMERLNRNLWRAIAEDLTPRQREVLLERFVGKKTVSAIAAELGLNKSSVSRALNRALRTLESLLKYSM